MTIKEVSDLTGFSLHTLRYYEKEGILKEIKRDSSGYRDFSQTDLDIIKFLSCLKKAGMSVDKIKGFTDLLYDGESTIKARIDLLEQQDVIIKKKLIEIQEVSDHITWKINYYRKLLK